MTSTRSWQVTGSAETKIGSINIAGFEALAEHVSLLFKPDGADYSGVILSNNEAAAEGQSVEKNCYKRGGLRFLYKSYAPVENLESFPVDQLVRVLSTMGRSYLRQVLQDDDSDAVLAVAWAVCQRDGDYGTLHNHVPPGGDAAGRYSGMFYLRTPDCITPATFPNGCLHIILDNAALYYPPIPGSCVIWPSWMLHGIHPFRGQGDRLGVAFDFTSRRT